MAPSLRLSLTLSGGASLGAFQAGAGAAVAVAVRHLADQEEVDARIDAVGGASAGSIVAAATAHALLEGIDAVDLLGELWVRHVSLRLLRGRGLGAPLTLDRVRRQAHVLLEPDGARRVARQEHPVALAVGLTGLQGLTYRLGGAGEDRPDLASTYVDWMRFELRPGGGVRQLLEPAGRSPLDAVLASSSHPGAFPPRLLDRRPDEDDYRARGIESFPRSGRLWYTDGGLLQSEPLGRVLEAARDLDAQGGADVRRVNLVIDPRSEDPAAAKAWSDPDHAATWASGLSRALAILPAQAVYDDLRHLETDNERLAWCAELAEGLAPHLSDGAVGALEAFLGVELPGDPQQALRRTLERITGVTGKQPVRVDLISPLLLTDGDAEDVTELLAGELLGDFGGFLSASLRASDFALGFRSGLAWLDRELAGALGRPAAAERAVAAARERRPASPHHEGRGRSRLGDLGWRARVRLARLAMRYGAAVAGEAAGGRRVRRPRRRAARATA